MMNYRKPYAIIGKSSLQSEMLTILRMFANGLSSRPPESIIEEWKNDYDKMVANMIYEDNVPTFSDILAGAVKIESMLKD